MAGAFGGDDYEEEELDDLEEELNDDEADEEEQLEEELTEEEKAKDKAISNRLKKIKNEAPLRFFPFLKDEEKAILRSAKKKPRHRGEVLVIERRMTERQNEFWMKVKSIIGPILPFLLVGALIFVAALAIAAAIDSIFGSLFGGGGGGSSGGGMSSQFGVSGKDFYGNRVIYRDNEQARIDILGGFVDYIDGAIDSVPNGSDYKLTINISIPEEYDYSKFDESTFANEYLDLYNLLAGNGSEDGIVDIVYKLDNPEGSATTLIEQLDAIKYFGLTLELNTDFASLVAEYINNNHLYTVIANGDGTSVDNSTIEQSITDAVTDYFAQLPTTRIDKLYIKDYIFASDDAKMSDIAQEDYVAMIFMPKHNVSFTSMSFAVMGVDVNTFSLYVMDGDNKIEFTYEVIDAEKKAYVYTWNKLGSISTDTFTEIDTNNLSYLSKAKSLLEIVRGDNSSLYVETIITEDGEIISAKISGINVQFESDEVFGFAEYETRL